MVVDLYPPIIHENDLSPEAVGDEIDDVCKEIHEACKGWGTDEDRLIKALASQNAENRCKIAVRYPEIYNGKELRKVMKSECGGDLGTGLQYLALCTHEMECEMIQRACRGFGTDELILYPIICGRSNKEISILKKKFFDLYTKDLGKVMDSELGGDLEKLIFNCLQGSMEEMDEGYHNEELVKQDVEDLYKAGQGKFGTDEAKMFKILCARPPEHLKTVNLEYADKHGFTLLKALETELGGHVRDASMFLLGMKLKPYETVAKLVKKACAGFGTNELLLTCCLIRYQPILPGVMEAHIELFGKSVEDRVKSETSGDYRKLLLEICAAATAN